MSSKMSMKKLRAVIREELLREGVIDQVSPAAKVIGQGIAAYLSGPDLRQKLKGVQIEDPHQVAAEVLQLTGVSLFRNPLEKLIADAAGEGNQQQQQQHQQPAQQKGNQQVPQRRASDRGNSQ